LRSGPIAAAPILCMCPGLGLTSQMGGAYRKTRVLGSGELTKRRLRAARPDDRFEPKWTEAEFLDAAPRKNDAVNLKSVFMRLAPEARFLPNSQTCSEFWLVD